MDLEQLFIRSGKQAGGAYRDALGDEMLGTCGALLAGVVVGLVGDADNADIAAPRG